METKFTTRKIAFLREDFTMGTANSSTNCPIARVYKREGFPDVVVGAYSLCPYGYPTPMLRQLSEGLRIVRRRVDNSGGGLTKLADEYTGREFDFPFPVVEEGEDNGIA